LDAKQLPLLLKNRLAAPGFIVLKAKKEYDFMFDSKK